MKKSILSIFLVTTIFATMSLKANSNTQNNNYVLAAPDCTEIAVRTYNLWYGETGNYSLSMSITHNDYDECVSLGGTPNEGGWSGVVHTIFAPR